jgi:hypothetical protein
MKLASAAKYVNATHGIIDAEWHYRIQQYVETKELRPFVVQEREVSYRVYPHFHPYVPQLVDRVVRQGLPALQAADTEYVPGGQSIDDSVEAELDAGARATLPSGTDVTLTVDTDVPLTDGTTVTMAAGMQLRTAAAADLGLPAGCRLRLVAGMQNTPARGTVVTLGAQAGSLLADAVGELTAVAGVTIYNGMGGSLPAATRVRIAAFDPVSVPANTRATIDASVARPVLYADILGPYQPTPTIRHPYPVRDLDFSAAGAYAVYNWELFFHAPLLMAMHLSTNGRYADAQRWLHFLFDPTDNSDGPSPQRFWKVRPFQSTDVEKIEAILVNVATGADPALQAETANSIDAWQRNPFRPHVIARYRQQAYMYKTVMAYLDNLIAWGDSLFRQDTGEAIDEALMVYMLAASILGPRPQPVPAKGATKPQTYANLRRDLRAFGTVLRDVEAEVPFDLLPLPAEDGAGSSPQAGSVRALGKALYFCVPRNDKLLTYWDTVADRLFKIHNSLNLQGVFRQLALFEPPIDPALLARAAAAGLDIAAVVNGLNQPLPIVRFQLLVQKAAEIAAEVKALGNNLLAAMEKEDGEALALLRAHHEREILDLVEHVKYAQVQEAIKNRESLERSLATAIGRFAFYERQLGRSAQDVEKAIPALAELDADGLDKMKFAMSDPVVQPRNIEVDIATDVLAQAAQLLAGGALLSSHEVVETLLLEAAQLSSDIGAALGVGASIAAVVPQFEVSAEPWGIGGGTTFGGSNVSSGIQAAAGAARGIADRLNFEARRAARIDGFARRERDWAYQSNLASGEINQIFRQLRAAQIRQAVAEMELKSHRQQQKHAAEIELFLNGDGTVPTGKTTNKSLYTWMKREVRGLYAQSFQLAFDVARKAERALQLELGDRSLTYLQPGYLAGKEGLLAGERLHLDLKRMDMAYLELNRREYELTKHVSLLQVDPQALVQLRATGRCTFRLDEELFNFDGPSHYFRRIKSVAVSVPCVAGPQSSVNVTLTLLKSSIRTTPTLGDRTYAREDSEDDRFDDYYGSTQSVVTSSGQNDSGMFEVNLRDERYLPFEHAGVISEWQLQLPANPSAGEPRQFDYATISDVILHLRYTAREGGDTLRKGAMGDLADRIEASEALGSVRLFALRYDFPSAWAEFQTAAAVGGFRPLTIELTPQHYPYWSLTKPGATREITAAELIVNASGDVKLAAPDGTSPDTLGAFLGNLRKTSITQAPKPPFSGTWSVGLSGDTIDDAWLLIHWGAVQ